MSHTILCVDIGTTSLKAALVTANGEVVSFCSLPFEDPHDRFIACSWYGTFLRALGELGRAITESSNVCVRGIAISGNGPTVVTDSGLTFLWNEENFVEADSIPECAKTSLFIPKILSVKKQFPDIYKKARRIFSGPEYLINILTGNAVTILPEARFAAAYWSDEVCKACGIKPGLLPPFVGTGADCGEVCRDVYDELTAAGRGLEFAGDCRVFSGGPDFVVALIGTGTLEAGRLCDRCGSSEGLNFCTAQPVRGEGLRTLPSVISGLWNVSYLIPGSGYMNAEEKLASLEKGINLLKKASGENGIIFPSEMAVTGGQSNDILLLKEKSERFGMKILHSAGAHFVHSELLGDACAGFTGLGVYGSLQEAAEKIVRLQAYENL